MSEEAAPRKRPRGRPRKNPLPQAEAVKNEDLPPSVVTFEGPESQDKFEWGEGIKAEEDKAKKPLTGSLPLTAADLASQLTGAELLRSKFIPPFLRRLYPNPKSPPVQFGGFH